MAAFNAVNPMITVATVPQYFRVDPGVMVATIKIISYAVPENDVVAAAETAGKAISVLTPEFSSATLIETAMKQEPSSKGRAALAGRLDRLGMTLTGRVIVPHDEDALAQAIAQSEGEVVFVLTASATSDVNDVGPAALRSAGGWPTQI